VPTQRDTLVRRLADLYAAHADADAYLKVHSSNAAALGRQVDAYLRYRPFVTGTRILDWGCRHAPDSCLLRHDDGAALDLHGCDVIEPVAPGFHAAAGLTYRVVDHDWRLPYDDGSFDTVVAGGVLEHVPDDEASLGELHRVLAPDGTLIVTFLPNRLSYTECLARLVGRDHHLRLYARAGIIRTFRRHGFEPVHAGYHQVTPSLSGSFARTPGPLARGIVNVLYRANGVLERTWGVRRLAANIMIVGRKRAA
jgi:SAM-dependent methyltransferase